MRVTVCGVGLDGDELNEALAARVAWMRRLGVASLRAPLATGTFFGEQVAIVLGPPPTPLDALQDRLANAKDEGEREEVREEIARGDAKAAKESRRQAMRDLLASSRPHITDDEIDGLLGEAKT